MLCQIFSLRLIFQVQKIRILESILFAKQERARICVQDFMAGWNF